MVTFGTVKKNELTDDLLFIHINSPAKSFMSRIGNIMTQLGMAENFVEIVLK